MDRKIQSRIVAGRNWTCPALEEARTDCPSSLRSQIMQQHPAFFNHGWVPTPSSLQPFREKIDEITPRPTWNADSIDPPSILDLFTDGSCWGPRDALARLASWGVVVATPNRQSDFMPVASGLLPGRYQSVARAELFAALKALEYASNQNRPFRLWVDNQFVVKRLRYFFVRQCSRHQRQQA